MAAKKNPLKRVRVEFQRSTPLVKTLVIAALVVCTVTLIALSIGISQAKENKEKDRQKAIALEQENAGLKEDIDNWGTIESFEDLARRLLHFVYKDDILYLTKTAKIRLYAKSLATTLIQAADLNSIIFSPEE